MNFNEYLNHLIFVILEAQKKLTNLYVGNVTALNNEEITYRQSDQERLYLFLMDR